jgi:hypothetical protein
LVDAIHSVHPVLAGINPNYWRVTSSRVTTVLRHNGIEFLSGRCKTELPEREARLIALARLVDEPRTRTLMPFIRDRVRIGRGFHEVTQQDFEDYCRRVDTLSPRKNKVGTKQGVRRDWNYFAERIDEWPKVFFTMESKRDDYLLPDKELPEAIIEFDAKADVPFKNKRTGRKRRKRLSPATIASRKYTFRRILSAAVAAGIPKEVLRSMADVCDPDVLAAAFNFILGRADKDGTCDVCRLAVLMRAVGEQWVELTGAKLEAINGFCEEYEHVQQGMAEKNKRMLAQFSSDRIIREFLKTPARVIARYNGVEKLTRHDCVEIQMATAMAILIRVLIRMENLKQIVDGTHLVESGFADSRKVLLIFGEDEVKNTEYLETLLSPRVVAVIDAYKERAWPRLRRGPSKFLFPGYGDKHKAASCFGGQLANFVRRHTGIRVTAHQFRHLGGFFHLLRRPGDYASVQKMLGHRRIETTIKYYTGTMERRAAFATYDADIDARIDEVDAVERATAKVRVKNHA